MNCSHKCLKKSIIMSKNTTLTFAFILLSLFVYAQKPKTDTLTVKTNINCDHCAKCESCQARIEHDLVFTTGVKSASLNVKEEHITIIYYTSLTNPDKIRKAINKAGYDADDQQAPPEAVRKLDGCCKK